MPSTSEIIDDLDTAAELANRSSTVMWRIKELLESEQFDNLKRHEALTLIEGLIPMPDEMLGALKYATESLGGGNDSNHPESESEEPDVCLRKSYEDVLRGKCSVVDYEDARDDLLNASETLATISSIAGDKECGEAADWLLTRAAYHTATLIKFSKAFATVGRTSAAKA